MLRHDLEDIFEREGTRTATVRAVDAAGSVRLETKGADERVAQRCRNVFGTYSIQSLRAAPRQSSRNLGQLLGLAWLAWMLLPSD